MAAVASLPFWSAASAEASMFLYTVKVIFMKNYLLLSSRGVIHSSLSPLSHHSVQPPHRPLHPHSHSHPSWKISHLTLSPSPFVLFHWPCMFQKQILFSSTVRTQPLPTPHPTPRPWTVTVMHCLLSKSKSCSCSCPLSHLPIAPPRDTPEAPPPQRHTHRPTPHPFISSHIGIWRRVPAGCPPIRGSLLV